ncbi:MAG: GNAT family N-acetyltransferase [Raoultibacter sp.]
MIEIRTVKQEDIQQIIALCKTADMDVPEDFDRVFVAEDIDERSPLQQRASSGPVAGFVRLRVIKGVAYINPLIVSEAYREQGIGGQLVNHVMDNFDKVSFVARGSAIPFYERLGFTATSWENLAPEITQDCATCEVRDACRPLPMSACKH